MKHFTPLTQIIVILLIIGCNNRTEIKVVDAKINEVHDSTNQPPPIPVASGLKVSAHLIYDDGSISTFDVLNEPSNSIKVNLTGALVGLNVRIKNGNKLVTNTTLPDNIENEFIIKILAAIY